MRLVAGGGSILWPVVEHLQVMNTAAFQTFIDEKNIPNKDNVKINVHGVATCKIASALEDLNNAAAAFLAEEGYEQDAPAGNADQPRVRCNRRHDVLVSCQVR